jgi:hypothetical protein
MRPLTKYVAVNQSGYWFAMEDSRIAAAAYCEQWPNLHVERWTYPVQDDGTYGTPTKQRLDGLQPKVIDGQLFAGE